MQLDSKETELLTSDVRVKCDLDNNVITNMTHYHDMHPDDLRDYEYSGQFDNDYRAAERHALHDSFPPFEDKGMERLHSALRVASADYKGIDIVGIVKKMARQSSLGADGEDLPIRHAEQGITMGDFKQIIADDATVKEAALLKGEPNTDKYFTEVLKNVGSVNILKNNFDAFDDLDTKKAISIMTRERSDITSVIEDRLSETYTTYKRVIDSVTDKSGVQYDADLADRVPKSPKYLDIIIADDNDKLMLPYMNSVMPALKGVSIKSIIGEIKEKDMAQFMEMADGNALKASVLAISADNEKLKFQASSMRPSPEAGMKHLLPTLHDFDVKEMLSNNALASKFTKTTANISMYTYEDTIKDYVAKPLASFSPDEPQNTWNGIKPAGSMSLITGIDGQSNPSYSEPRANSFAVMNINKPLHEAQKILVGASPDMRDTAGFAYMTENNGKPAYDAILYVPPQNFDGVIQSISQHNKNLAVDVLGDLIPHKVTTPTADEEGIVFEEAPVTGLDFAKHVEMNAIKNNITAKVLLPVGGMQTWDELRQKVTEMSVTQGLGHEQAKSYFNQTVNSSMVDSNIRTTTLKHTLDNQEVKPIAITQEILEPEPVIANNHTIEQPRNSNRSRF